MTAVANLSGKRFGRLIAVARQPSTLSGHAVWSWKCDCGEIKDILATNVKRGVVSSCGCFHIERVTKHGMYGTRTYSIWQGMKSRAAGTGKINKKYYADRGISVCPRWAESFDNFLSDMGECPLGMSIDRIDNDGNYEPENCRWATQNEQMANTRRTHHVVVNGKPMCLAAACKETGIKYPTAMKRMRHGMTAQEAIA